MKKVIPKKGYSEKELDDFFDSFKNQDINWKSGKAFGAVYYPGDEYAQIISKAYIRFLNENAFDPQLFKSLLAMENDIVSQVANLISPEIKLYGNLTSGGTESIFLALLSARDWSKKNRQIKNPEVILPSTAHPAFLKALHFLNIKSVIIHVDVLKWDLNSVENEINENTIMLVGSAPAYPYGSIDPISNLSELAVKHDLLLHVDACIGGFFLSYLKKMGTVVPEFNFNLPGVTSLSVDLHKYAYAPKGSSVLLYRNPEQRLSQYSVYSSWQGGIYASTTFMGTKPGGVVASTWTALNHIGDDGYLDLTKSTMSSVKKVINYIESNIHLELIGNPDMSLIAFKVKDNSTYELADLLNDKGWYIGRLQNPEGIHLVVSAIHSESIVKSFTNDIDDSLAELFSTNFRSSIQLLGDNLLKRMLNLLPYNQLKTTLAKQAKKSNGKPSKKRIIYEVKNQLSESESNNLFRSIMDRFYS